MDQLLSITDVTEAMAERYPDNPPSRATVKRWAKEGRFDGAEIIGNSYVIPESALAGFERPRMGRPPEKEGGER